MTCFNQPILCRAPDDSSGSDTQPPVIKRLEALIAPVNAEKAAGREISIYSIVKQDQKIIFMENSQAVADWKVDNPKIEQHVRLMLGLEPLSP